jgi:hypothetical protein
VRSLEAAAMSVAFSYEAELLGVGCLCLGMDKLIEVKRHD